MTGTRQLRFGAYAPVCRFAASACTEESVNLWNHHGLSGIYLHNQRHALKGSNCNGKVGHGFLPSCSSSELIFGTHLLSLMLRLSLFPFRRRVFPARLRSFDTQLFATHRPYSNASRKAMSTPTVRYKYIEEVEVLEDYRPGGYHPVQINDTLRHDRYQIVHKPGHGTFSTAWLALDRNSSTYVAVKVGASYADKNEVDILSRLAMTGTDETMIRQNASPNAPLVVRPPESYFEPTKPLTFESDIWSLSCLIFELFAHRSLIDGIIAPQDDITAQQVHLQGIPPPEWWDKWDKRSKWFDNKGQALSNEQDIWSWDRRFRQWIQEPRKSEGMETINSEEAAALLDLLKRVLAWKPENRPQAQQILESGWVKEWALPAYNKTKRTPEVERA
ncbi:hypothetical protein FOXYS1_9420 [Fusarium oxysporum]|uniref:non-specific serine/threonine protein kinase n=1 Tax=Fusarium oxysporum TaxID=5507 RepID=A0A8H5EGK6_FUSOX|nr:hypothetical protein FOXYS1_9420 [Fusarium oxysporum]